MEKKRVVVVDDEPQIAEVLAAYLERDGFDVTAFSTVSEAMQSLAKATPDLLILDVMLPDGSGLDVLRTAARAEPRIPTIMLTARAEEADRIVGLELGADDYVTKPFFAREVVARVRALLRRAESGALPVSAVSRVTRLGDLEIDHTFYEVRLGGRLANLTATEFRILAILAENPGEVFTRAHLLDRLGDDGQIFERTLDRHINNLRKKVEPDPRNPEYVLTVYGIGYKMRR